MKKFSYFMFIGAYFATIITIGIAIIIYGIHGLNIKIEKSAALISFNFDLFPGIIFILIGSGIVSLWLHEIIRTAIANVKDMK